ncbi:Fur-regulated basic protein FbpA [Fictibacillus aquaticus]|uniref:Fur-regulated basic protein FbpA n=1 Tax=Fictibacillus aquaticus TaxID=2021314 RepID=A0A235FAD0_9BACL|nr:Fur-regulated basic protein FbpA [Fictibacillus aquaticus]OYD57887.1 hypothetical protein CGZ90_08275 [Fictibacillus aquaticus]
MIAAAPNRLRTALDLYRKQLISELIKCGIFKDQHGRQLFELTLTELEDEMRWVNLQREGDVIY